MGLALIEAARESGIRIALLDTCYLSGGLDADGYRPLSAAQARFGDGDVDSWRSRVAALDAAVCVQRDDAGGARSVTSVPRNADDVRLGAAMHSVRAVPATMLPTIAAATRDRPVHVHLSEQPAENEACLAFHGRTPAELLADAGLLAPNLTAVHATHLTPSDIALLGGADVTACICPSTEADLADGIGPARELADAGSPISLGSDQHALVDALGEMRALEHGERLRTGRLGRFTPAELVDIGTVHGHRCLGWPGAGRIAPGAPCDLVAVRTDTARTAGAAPEQLVHAAGGADVHEVVIGGRTVVRDGAHRTFGAVGPELAEVIEELWRT
jgi:formiminoglutamate deiminase